MWVLLNFGGARVYLGHSQAVGAGLGAPSSKRSPTRGPQPLVGPGSYTNTRHEQGGAWSYPDLE